MPLQKFYERDNIGTNPQLYYERLFQSVPTYRQSQAQMFAWAFENQIFNNNLENFVEFGTYAGESLALAFQAWQFQTRRLIPQINATINREYQSPDTKFFAFDSFNGLPKSRECDHQQHDYQPGDYNCSERECTENLEYAGVDMAKVQLISGWYKNSLRRKNQSKLGKVSLVHIDCDHYESAKLALDFITPALVDGSILMFDDWYTLKSRPDTGEQRAFSEWINKNKGIAARPWIPYTANALSFIVNFQK